MEYLINKITNKRNNKTLILNTSKTFIHRRNNHIRQAKIGSTSYLLQSMMKHTEGNFYEKESNTYSTEDYKFCHMVPQIVIYMPECVKKGDNMEIGFGWNVMDSGGKNDPIYGKESEVAKRVFVYVLVYKNMGICSEELGINRSTITGRCNSEIFPLYEYC
ncbi:homing endonuclease [Staphylococcus phage vB_SauH_DELF3]|nr:homing endonuclease [Staphylococcus phage vB_SauH_DELF3]